MYLKFETKDSADQENMQGTCSGIWNGNSQRHISIKIFNAYAQIIMYLKGTYPLSQSYIQRKRGKQKEVLKYYFFTIPDETRMKAYIIDKRHNALY